MRMLILCALCAGVAFGKPKDKAGDMPPDPSDSAWLEYAAENSMPADPTDAFAQVRERVKAREAARQAEIDAMPVTTQRMERVKGEMLAGIETDAKGGKTAKIVKSDGTVEFRKLKVLHTARVLPKAEKPKGKPFDGGDAAAGAVGLVAGAAAALAGKKFLGAGAPGAAGN